MKMDIKTISTTHDEPVKEAEVSQEVEEEIKDDLEEASEETQDESKDDKTEEQKPKKKGGFQRKLERVEREKQELAARLAELEKKISQPKPEQKIEKKVDDGRPKLEDFEDQASYIEAVADWKLEQKEKQKAEAASKDKERSEFESKVKSFSDKAKEFGKSVDDYEDTILDVDHIPLSRDFESALLDSEIGPQVLYELAKNPAEFAKVNSMPRSSIDRMIGRLEEKLTQTKTTKAPPPPKPVGAKGSGSLKKPEDMDFAEYKKWRASQK